MKDLDFRVGDVVTSILHGVGVVKCVCNDFVYPVQVRFRDDTICAFTRGGKCILGSSKRVLYHGEIHGNFYVEAEVKPTREKNTKSYKQRTLDKWFWFIMNPGKGSGEYIATTGRLDELEILNNCWACELAKVKKTIIPPMDCSKCPIKGFRSNRCYIDGSLFWQWRDNRTSENARKMYDIIFNTWEE